jgi:hypothetical protein
MTVFNGKVMFSGLDGGLWETDGSSGGTQEIAGTATAGTGLGSYDSYPYAVAPGGLQPYGMVVLNGELLFGGSTEMTYTPYGGSPITIQAENLLAYNGSSFQVISGEYPGGDEPIGSNGAEYSSVGSITLYDTGSSLYSPGEVLGYFQGDYYGFLGGGLDFTDGTAAGKDSPIPPT